MRGQKHERPVERQLEPGNSNGAGNKCTPAKSEIVCPLCGCLADRHRNYLSCGLCGPLSDSEVISLVRASTVDFARRMPGLRDHAPERDVAHVSAVAEHLFKQGVDPKLAEDLVLVWAQVRVPRVPSVAVALAIEAAAEAELRRGAK